MRLDKRSGVTWTELALLAVIALIGLILLLVAFFTPSHSIGEYLLLGTGSSFVIASIVGLAVELGLSQRLAKDAVEAGLGYLVLPEAREEMRRIYEQQFMCVRHQTTITIVGTENDDTVMVRNHTVRTFRNITGQRQAFQPNVRYREWFRPQVQSRLIGLGISKGAKNPKEYSEYTTLVSTNSVSHSLAKAIDLDKGEECTFWYEVEEPKQATDVYYETFTNPTVNPQLTIMVAKGDSKIVRNLGITGGFASHLEKEAISLGTGTKELQGILLPYGYIEVRWWDKDKMEKWHSAIKQKGIRVI